MRSIILFIVTASVPLIGQLKLDDRETVEISVVDGDGNWVPTGRLQILDSQEVVQSAIDMAGEAVLVSLAKGKYHVSYSGDSWISVSRDVEVTASLNTVVSVTEPISQLLAGPPVRGVLRIQISVDRACGANTQFLVSVLGTFWSVRNYQRTDSTGFAHIANIPPGRYLITVYRKSPVGYKALATRGIVTDGHNVPIRIGDVECADSTLTK